MYLALSRDHLVNEKNDGNVTYYYAMDGAYDYENYYDLIEEALRQIKDQDFDGVELMYEKMHLSSIDESNIEED